MGAEKEMPFFPVEGARNLLRSDVPAERKVAIMLACIGDDQELEGLEKVFVAQIKGEISRFAAKYASAVAKRKKAYEDKKKEREAANAANAAKDGKTGKGRKLPNSPAQTKPNQTERNGGSINENTPPNPPLGGVESGFPPPTSLATVTQEEREDFEAFWEVYPRKTGGKFRALQAWHHAVVERGLTAGAALTALNEQAKSDEWRREGGRFVPMAFLWLERGQWEDVPVSAPADEKKGGAAPARDPLASSTPFISEAEWNAPWAGDVPAAPQGPDAVREKK